MRRRLGDRRIRPRFDIVGDLLGTIQMTLRLPLRNVGRGGALIESNVPLPAHSVHRLTFAAEGREVAVDVRVRHARPAAGGDRRYLIGVEFLALSPLLTDLIDAWMAEGNDEAALLGGVAG